ELTATALTLQTESGAQTVPLEDLQEVRFPETKPPAAAAGDKPIHIALADGSQFIGSKLTIADRTASIETPGLGAFDVALTALANVRFESLSTPALQEAWDELLKKDTRRDMLVIQKGETLDHLDGFIGNVTEERISFVLDGDEIPVNRAKVFGVIYAPRRASGSKAVCRIALAGGGSLQVQSLGYGGETLAAKLMDGSELALPVEAVRSLDFSLGKVLYLSEIDPRGEPEYVTFITVGGQNDPAEAQLIRYRRNQNADGDQLKIGNKFYARGLWLHPRTTIRFRIGGEYRLFRATAGIEQSVAAEGLGNVDLILRGDGKELFRARIASTDDPLPIELDVTGVRDLELFVDWGENLHLCDHLALGDAQVTK
ncbi:MAG: NPCBM/NEW2 domain-containing protein, partial [Planctomycetaceae bacterium]